MKFKLQLKDPDGVYDSITEYFKDFNDLPDEVDAVIDKFVRYSEYVTIELDTETQTARVVPQ